MAILGRYGIFYIKSMGKANTCQVDTTICIYTVFYPHI